MAYVHVIDLKPTFGPNSEKPLENLYELYSSQLCFGILSSAPFPEICEFPVYTSSGQITVNLQINQSICTLSAEQVLNIRKFHNLIFTDLINILKDFLVFDNDEGSDCLLIVPVCKQKTDLIDFNIMAAHRQLYDQKEEPSDQEKHKIKVTRETYVGKIVSPWYRSEDKVWII